jgi:hypothetical protein
MTKKSYREDKRVSPLGVEGIAAIRRILETKQNAKVNEVLVDAFSASIMIAVFDAVNDLNKTKIMAMPLVRAFDVCAKVYRKAK